MSGELTSEQRNEFVRAMAVPIMEAIGGNEPYAREVASEALRRLELRAHVTKRVPKNECPVHPGVSSEACVCRDYDGWA